MTSTDESIFDQAAERPASEAGIERPAPNWTVLVVAIAACLTMMWTGLLLWAAAAAVCAVLG